MSEIVSSWDDISGGRNKEKSQNTSKNPQDQKKVKWTKLGNDGVPILIRPIQKPVKFYKIVHQDSTGKYNAANLGSNIKDKDNRYIEPYKSIIDKMMTKYGPKLKPSLRYAINVINRKTGFLEIYEGPPVVFMKFREFREMTRRDPGSDTEGVDWSISKTGTGLGTVYDIKRLDDSPLTDKEKIMINEENIYNLEKICRVTPIEEIEKRALGADYRPDDGSASQSNTQPTSPVEDGGDVSF